MSSGWASDRQPDAVLDLSSLRPTWFDRAACRGAGPDLFFRTKGDGVPNTGDAAKDLCRLCPVLIDCLTSAVEDNEHFGIRGGAGGSTRRALRRAWVNRDHESSELVKGCSCPWCSSVREHVGYVRDGVLRVKGGRKNFGPGATHGRRSTQAKGCRCTGCTWSASVSGQLAARLGLDCGSIWREAEREPDPRFAAERAVLAVGVRLLEVFGVVGRLELDGLRWNEVGHCLRLANRGRNPGRPADYGRGAVVFALAGCMAWAPRRSARAVVRSGAASRTSARIPNTLAA